nr:cysteine desulfurase [Gemmatimonadaceae bacterium]
GLHYLDSAATTQKPAAVLDAMRGYYEHDNANPHRGAYALSARATQRYHDARETVARFFGVRDASTIIFTRGTTEAINLVAHGWGRPMLQPGDDVVVTGLEHHANFVPWQQVARDRGARFLIAELTADGQVDLDHLQSLIGDRTRVVAFGHVSNALGTINPVAEIAAMAKRAGALVVVDGAQGAPHLEVEWPSLDAAGVDLYAFSGHKMLGPMGIGGLLGRRSVLEAMSPYQTGGDMIDFVGDIETTWNVLPHKFEAGTPNVADAVGLGAACDYLSRIGMARVRAHEVALIGQALERLASIPEVRIHGPMDPALRSGVVAFTVEGVHPHDLATILDDRNVCIRAGHHCAQPLMRRLQVPATARASFYVYSDGDDVEALAAGVEQAITVFAG